MLNFQVLQVLVFCTPFYDFLSKIMRRAAHTFKSDTPLIDALYVSRPYMAFRWLTQRQSAIRTRIHTPRFCCLAGATSNAPQGRRL